MQSVWPTYDHGSCRHTIDIARDRKIVDENINKLKEIE